MITPETMLIVAGAAFLLFGGKKLPELGRSLGHGIREFKNGTQGLKDELNANLNPEPTHSSAQNSVLPSISTASALQTVIAPSTPTAGSAATGPVSIQVPLHDTEDQRR